MSFAIVVHLDYVTCIFYEQITKLINSSFKRHFALWLFLSCHNALWLFKNSHNTQFRVVAVSLMPQRVVVVFSAQ